MYSATADEINESRDSINKELSEARAGAAVSLAGASLLKPLDLLAYNGDRQSQEFVIGLIRDMASRRELGSSGSEELNSIGFRALDAVKAAVVEERFDLALLWENRALFENDLAEQLGQSAWQNSALYALNTIKHYIGFLEAGMLYERNHSEQSSAAINVQPYDPAADWWQQAKELCETLYDAIYPEIRAEVFLAYAEKNLKIIEAGLARRSVVDRLQILARETRFIQAGRELARNQKDA